MPDLHFLWVGGRPEDVRQWQARAVGLANLTFAGFIPNRDLPTYQAAADILVMPYQSAVAGSSGGDISGVFSPLKMFEYMACGRPILCSDLPTLREVLTEQMAVFCPPDDPSSVPGQSLDAWQAAIRRCLADRKFSASLARQARLEAAKYTWLQRTRRTLEGFGR
jgi:glycosyltransferase involved in cell wall biosynthesis